MVEIIHATTQEHFDQVRSLMREFVVWQRQRNLGDLAGFHGVTTIIQLELPAEPPLVR